MSGIPIDGIQGLVKAGIGAPVRASGHLARWWARAMAHWLIVPTFVFAVHFLIVQIAATTALTHGRLTASFASSRARAGQGAPVRGTMHDLIEPLARWDGIWYIRMASSEISYKSFVQFERFGTSEDTLWPLLPWVMRTGARLPGASPALIGYLFVNTCFFVALATLYRLIADEFDLSIARRSLWCIVLLPASFFYQAISTEAPFLCFVALAFLAARNDRWFLAGVFGLLAALTQAHGVLLMLPLLALGVTEIRAGRQRWSPRLAFLLLPLLGPLVYLGAWHRAGYSWQVLAAIQKRQFALGAPPWKALDCATQGCSYWREMNGRSFRQPVAGIDWTWGRKLLEHPSWRCLADQRWRHDLATSGSLDLVVAIACLLLAAIGLFWLPRWMSAYTFTLLVVVLVRTPFDHPLAGSARFSLLLFPLAIVLAKLLDEWVTRALACLVSLALLVGLTAQFANWYWVS